MVRLLLPYTYKNHLKVNEFPNIFSKQCLNYLWKNILNSFLYFYKQNVLEVAASSSA